jgi:hypothetical protein
MRQAGSKSVINPSETRLAPANERAVPTFIATDLLEKLIADCDAMAVRKVVVRRRH